MKFSELSVYFDRISRNSARLEITRILAELFNKLSGEEIEKVVYLLQGRVRPAYEGIDFGVAEKMIIRAAISALNIEKSFFEKENGEWRFIDAQGVQLGTYRRTEPKAGRNDPCACGSGKKFKKCCWIA